jgi:replicative DNA helicase
MNSKVKQLTSLELERNLLSGLINHPSTFANIEGIVSDLDFTLSLHSVIFSVLKNTFMAGEVPDKAIVAKRVKDTGIKPQDVDIFDYIDSIAFSQITEEGTLNTSKELAKLRICRELYQNAEDVQNYILKSKSDKISNIISGVDGIYNKKINLYSEGNEPIDVYDGLEEFLLEIASNPVEKGLVTPFKNYNNFFGNIHEGDGIYVFGGRLGEGKSVFLYNLAKGISMINQCPVLYIDSEMSLYLNRIRAAAMEAGVNTYFLSKGKWAKNKEMVSKVTAAFSKFRELKGKLFHIYLPNAEITDVLTTIRKWYYKVVGRGNKAFVVFDYLKVNDSESNRQEWQKLGDWVNYLNECGNKLGIPIAAGAQQNRTGSQNGFRLDDATTIGGSDRILQFGRFGGLIRRKTVEELTSHGVKFGTHLLKPVKYSRDNGEIDYNSCAYIKVPDPHTQKSKIEQNFINLDIKHYAVTEKGTLQDIVDSNVFHKPLKDNTKKDEDDGSINV